METEQMIAANEFCVHHNIDVSFICSLNESGLLDITTIEEKVFVPVSQLKNLEKLMRLNYELEINLEGIESITYLLQRITYLNQHIVELTNKLAFYEDTLV